MKKINQTLEVLNPEVAVIPLEEKIESALIKANVTEKVLAEMKEKYGELRLKSIDDKESYLELKVASKEIRKIEIIAEKICKSGREDAVKEQKLWLKAENDFLQKSGVIKNPLDADIEKFENEVERKELLEAKKREEVYINRQAILLKYGAQYNNGSFELNHISYEVELIKQADNEQWEDTILPKYRKVYEEIEVARVEEENKRKAEMELAKKQREEFEAQQTAFKLQQEEFAKQQKALQEQKYEVDRHQRLEQERKDAEAKKKREERIDNRLNQLYALGMKMNFQYNAFMYEDVNIDVPTEINLFNDTEWDALIEKVIPAIEQRKKIAEEKILVQLEKENQETIELAAQQERERIHEEQRQAEIKKQQEELRKQQEMEVASDKEKYADIVKYLKNTPTHLMKSSIYKGKMNIINDFINDL